MTPTSAREVDRTAEAISYSLSLQLLNEGSQEIPLDWYAYDFTIEGMGTFAGRWAALRVLPPKTAVMVEIPAVIPITPETDLSSQAPRAWTLSGNVRYQAPGLLGRILFDAGIRRPSEGFSGSGTIQDPAPVQPAQDA